MSWRERGVALAARVGFTVTRRGAPIANVDAGFDAATAGLEAFTMTSRERLHALYQAARYVEQARIPGAIVECGVWRGGSMMLVCRTLLELGAGQRELCLFDTFAGMTAPTADDVDVAGRPAAALLAAEPPSGERESVWCVASLEDVRANVLSTGYPAERCAFVVGRVEDTIPARAPERIALLRLDTDWYASTRHELEQLFPRLVDGGVLIVDDYGHWRGARKAVDEYLAAHAPGLLLHRIDATGRIATVRRGPA
jgi:O-methyltransferase